MRPRCPRQAFRAFKSWRPLCSCLFTLCACVVVFSNIASRGEFGRAAAADLYFEAGGEPPFQVKGGYPSVWGGEDATQLTFLCLGLAAICQALVLIETLFFPWQDLGVLYITSINMLASDSTPPRPPPPALGPCQHGGGVPRGVRGGASAGAWSMTGTSHTPPGV